MHNIKYHFCILQEIVSYQIFYLKEVEVKFINVPMTTFQSVCSEVFAVCVLIFMYVLIPQGSITLLYAFLKCFICIGTQRNIYILLKVYIHFFPLRKEKGVQTLIISRDSKYIFGSSLPELFFIFAISPYSLSKMVE